MAKRGLITFIIILILASCSSAPRYGRAEGALKYKKAASAPSKKSKPKSKRYSLILKPLILM